MTFGQLLEYLGRIPIPPYLNRESELIDYTRYQTVYSKFEGSVAAPTAGLHFTPELIEGMKARGFGFEEVTLHVGAGTFLPVKDEDAAKHPMHTEHFEVRRATVVALLAKLGAVTAVGTTSVRTLESLPALAWRIHTGVPIDGPGPVGQWELYDIPADYTGRDALEELLAYMDAKGLDRIKAATQIMIAPLGYEFRIVRNIITNFHQPKSTLLLLVSAFAGEDWRRIYDYALSHETGAGQGRTDIRKQQIGESYGNRTGQGLSGTIRRCGQGAGVRRVERHGRAGGEGTGVRTRPDRQIPVVRRRGGVYRDRDGR